MLFVIKKWILLPLLGLLTLAACDGDSPVFVSLPEGQLVVEAENSVLAAGTTQQYTATLITQLGSDPGTLDVTSSAEWLSSDPAVASVDANGLVTALAAGVTDIVATQGAYRGRSPLQVSDQSITEIIIEPAKSKVLPGLEQQFTAIARFSDNTTQDITFDAAWSSSDPSIATINNSGLATGVAVGSATITASFSGTTASTSLDVINTLVDSFVVTPFNNTLPAGGQVQLQGYLTLIDGSSIDVTDYVDWSSSDASVASVGDTLTNSRVAADAKGLVTAVSQGNAVITASAALPGGTLTTTANVTVTAALLSSLQVLPAVESVPLGTTGTFRAIAYYTDNSVDDVTRQAGWLSDDHEVVFVVTTGDRAGDAKAAGIGQARISANFEGQSATSDITVSDAVITSIQLTPVDLKVPVGRSGNYLATAIYSDNSTDDITLDATWVASDPAVVDIVPTGSDAGFATMLAVGSSTVSASFNGISGSTSLEVTPATISAFQIAPADISVPAGTTGQYIATAYYTDGSSENVTEQVTWQSTDQNILDVVTSGTAGGSYSANAAGTVTVTADFEGFNASTSATVTAATIISITVTPLDLSLPLGSSGQFKAQAVYTDNSVNDITGQVSWLSSDPAVAQIIATGSNAGAVNTLAQGVTTISAGLDGITGETSLTVTQVVITSLQVTPADARVPAGTTGPYTATAFYTDNSSEDVSRQATWQSSKISVATVIATGSDGGITTTHASGTAQISASFAGITQAVPLTVTLATLVSIEVSPVDKSVANGVSVQYKAIGIYTDGSSSDLSDELAWKSDVTAVATISDIGLADTLSAGVTTISASKEGITGSTTLTVTAAVVTGFAVIPFDVRAYPGDSGQLISIAYYSDNTSEEVTQQSTWSSSNTDVVVVVPGGEKAGFAVAVGDGSADVIARFQDFTASIAIEIIPAVLESIQIIPVDDSLAKGLTLQYTATGIYSDGNSSDISSDVAWASSDTAIATIEAGGLATAVNADIAAVAISASLSGVSSSASLNVTSATITKLQVSPSTGTVPHGTEGQFNAIAYYTDATSEDVTSLSTWTSSDKNVAVIEAAGADAGYATAVGTGVATITAAYNGLTAISEITVSDPVLESMQVVPINAELPVGTSRQYHAIAVYTDGSAQNVTEVVEWQSSESTVAVVELNGNVHGLATGSSSISADFAGINSNRNVTVTAAVLTGLVITPKLGQIPLGLSGQMVATAYYSDDSTLDVTQLATWSSSAPAVASVIATGVDGGYLQTLSVGAAVITARLDSEIANTDLTVTSAVLSSIQLDPANETVALGYDVQYAATGIYSNGDSADITDAVTWLSSNPAVVTIDASGYANTLSTGSSQMSASLDGIAGTAELTVSSANITAVIISQLSIMMPAGTTVRLTAVAYYSDNSSQDVTGIATWSSSDTSVAEVVAIGTDGGLTSALIEGNATVSATYEGFSGSSNILVSAAVLDEIQLDPQNETVANSGSVQYMAVGVYSDDTTANLSNEVTWFSDNHGLVVIDQSGLATVSENGSGLVNISATLNGISDTTPLNVVGILPVAMEVRPALAKVDVNASQQYEAVILFNNGSKLNATHLVSWQSSATGVAVISNESLNKGLATGISEGVSSITASINYEGVMYTQTALLQVVPEVLQEIVISSDNQVIQVNHVSQFHAQGIYSSGFARDITRSVTWASQDTAVAIISNSPDIKGLSLGVGAGETDITATLDGITNSQPIKVIAVTVVSLAVTPLDQSVGQEDTLQYKAEALYSDGSEADVTGHVVWRSDNDNIATISSSGNATGVAQGVANISATIDGISDTTSLTVSGAGIVNVIIIPDNLSIGVGTDFQLTASVELDGVPIGGTNDVIWSSSDESVAVIRNDEAYEGYVTGVDFGTSTITASYVYAVDGQTYTGSLASFEVIDLPAGRPVSIDIAPKNTTITLHQDQQYSMQGVWDLGGGNFFVQEITDDGGATWKTDDAKVVSISNGHNSKGLATGEAAGTANITGNFRGIEDTTGATVQP